MQGKPGTTKTTLLLLLSAAALVGSFAGCNLFGGGVVPAPFGQITAIQLFEDPNFTMALSAESAIINPDAVTKINWVFGDGGGFVEAAPNTTSIQHRYAASGEYEVIAYLFDSNGFADQVSSMVKVEPNDQPPAPDPAPDPDDLPGNISSPLPADEATDVDVATLLSWISGINTDEFDVFLGTNETDVENADTASAGIYKGRQSEVEFDPEGLTADTEYFWRIDSLNDLGVTTGSVMSFTTAESPEAAKNPTPVSGSTTARVNQVLAWVAGDRATSHDVYFGTNAAAVAAADNDTDDIFEGNQNGTTFDPEDDAAVLDGQLLASTTYYWRIDEVGLGGTTEGTVWSFTTADPPPKITSPSPPDGATDVDVNQNLGWEADPSVESFDIYFGIDPVVVADATLESDEFEGNQTGKAFEPGELLGSTDYYYRIDTLGEGGTQKGDVIHFTTIAPPGQVVGPFSPPNSPAPGSTEVDIETDLSWNTGGGGPTTSFAIYLSSNNTAVVNGSASALQATQDAAFTTLDDDNIVDLDPDTDYFWRVDAIGPGGITTGTVQKFTTGTAPIQTADPVPSNGQIGVALDVILSWSAAIGADDYDVYFGDSQSAVQNAGDDDAEYKGRIVPTNYTPGPLEGNKQYFWRIDAHGPGGVTTGDVWNFTTAPEPATAPSPADGNTGLGLDVTLAWTAGSGAVTHDVYLGDDETAVTNATNADAEFKINQANTSYDANDLSGNTTYYWRIDEVGLGGTTAGTVWSFTTGSGQAAEPISPPNGATGVDLMPTLEWSAGDGAASHDIYFGTDPTAVADATKASPEYITTQLLGNETYAIAAALDANTVYYWRIDEVTSDDVVTEGVVWQFRTRTGEATDPMPPDGELGVDVNADLAWTAATGATLYDVFFGTSEGDVTASTSGAPVGATTVESTSDPSLEIDMLSAMTTYYWRVDAIGPGGTTTSDTWEFTTGAAQATDPVPADGQSGVSLTTLLDWTPDLVNVTSHDIYFGTTQVDVENAAPGDAEYQGTFLLADAPTFNPGPLSGMTFYFWRVDSVTADGVTMGDVWLFRTGPDKASNPLPADFASGTSVDTNLTWTAGTGAVSHDVYFGTSLADVTNATISVPLGTLLGTVPGTIIDPGTLDGDTTYYWRVDSVAADGTTRTTGDVWRFTTEAIAPPQATGPSPADGATSVALPVTLMWDTIAEADSYDIYLGTDANDVSTATSSDPEFQDNRTGTSFITAGLTSDTVYYWRIDTVNAGGTTKGQLWTFTTEP